MSRQLLTQEEFDSISTLEEALQYLHRFVKRSPGRRPIGSTPKSKNQLQQEWRNRKRKTKGDA